MKAIGSWAISVRGRLTIAVTVLFAGFVLFGSWFLLTRAEAAWVNDLQAQDLSELEQLATDLVAIDVVEGGIGSTVIPLPVGIDGTTFMLVDATGSIFGATPVDVFSSGGILQVMPPNGASDVVFTDVATATAVEATGTAATVSLPIELDGGSMTLVASSSLAPIEAGVDALRSTLLLMAPLLIAAVAALAWFVTGRAFRPVAAITSQVERISGDRLDERVPVPSSRDEVAHLAQTMNHMLDRLSDSRLQQRRFVSDASHELRNPVATSKAKLEVGLAHSANTDWESTARIVLEEQDRLGSLIDDLLLLARLDESREAATVADVDLDDIVYAEAARPHPRPVDVSEVSPVRIRGDLNQLTRLIRNLVDNATRHGQTSAKVILVRQQDNAALVVEDDGPGIPEEDRERVLERFVRTDAARARAQGGTGLGLAIVDAVARAHDGRVVITEAANGGTRVEVLLPLKPGE